MVSGNCKDAFHPIVPIHERVQFYLSIEHEQSSSTGSSKVLTNHLNMGGMLTSGWLYVYVLHCLGSYSMDFCPAASVESKYGQWRRSFACARDASYLHSRISLVSFMTTRSVRALEDHVAWSSRTFLFSGFCCSSVSVLTSARVSKCFALSRNISYH